LIIVAARFALSLAFLLVIAVLGSGFAVPLAVLVLDFVILLVPRHFLRPDSAKRVDVHLPVLFAAHWGVSSDPLPFLLSPDRPGTANVASGWTQGSRRTPASPRFPERPESEILLHEVQLFA
jgi:hypothetical protein